MRSNKPSRHPVLLAVVSLSLLLGGCAHVSKTQMEANLAELRGDLMQQMAQGDRMLSDQIDDLDARVAALESDLDTLRNEFDATVERGVTSTLFNLPVHFDFDRADIRPGDKPVLDRFADVVKRHFPKGMITVEGFADPAGSEEYNVQLGLRRANAVKTYIERRGLSPDVMVRAVSYGESPERSVAPGASGAQGLENRRVVLVIDHEGTVPDRRYAPERPMTVAGR